MTDDDDVMRKLAQLDGLLNGDRESTYTCDDGMVIAFDGKGRSRVDLVATEVNRKAKAERSSRDGVVDAKFRDIYARLDAMTEAKRDD